MFFLNQHCCRLLCWRRRGSLLLAVSSSTRLFVNIHSCINYPSAGVGVALIIPPRDNVSSSSVLSRWYFYSREKGNPGQTGSYSDLKIKEGWRKNQQLYLSWCIRGVMVQRSHGWVRTSTLTSQFSVQNEKCGKTSFFFVVVLYYQTSVQVYTQAVYKTLQPKMLW